MTNSKKLTLKNLLDKKSSEPEINLNKFLATLDLQDGDENMLTFGAAGLLDDEDFERLCTYLGVKYEDIIYNKQSAVLTDKKTSITLDALKYDGDIWFNFNSMQLSKKIRQVV